MPSMKLALTLNANYSINDAEFDPVIMPEAPAEVEENIEAANYDFSMVHTYSDMSYKLLNMSLKIDYLFSKSIRWNAEAVYLKFNDDTGYIYGDETGSLYFIRTGIEYSL